MTTILVADDEAPIRELLTEALLGEGYTVVTVADGRAAFDQVTRECPALIITDTMMPCLSGTALIALLRAAPMDTPPVLLMSAATPQQPLTVPFLAKPFDLGQLFAMVQEMTGTP